MALKSIEQPCWKTPMPTSSFSNPGTYPCRIAKPCIEVKLMSLQGGSDGFFFRFRQTSDSLTIFTPYYNRGHDEGEGSGDIPVTDPSAMKQYGIDSLEVHYKKEALSGKKMVLRSRRLRLYFRKF